jgi:hypothetical protein
MGIPEHTETVMALGRNVGIPSGKATQAYWQSPAALAKYGPYAVSYGLLALRQARDIRKPMTREQKDKRNAKRRETRRVTDRERTKKEEEARLRNNARRRERRRLDKFNNTESDGKRQKKLRV